MDLARDEASAVQKARREEIQAIAHIIISIIIILYSHVYAA